MKTKRLRSLTLWGLTSIVTGLWPAGDAMAARNIILFIGDGMGPDHVKAGRWYRNAPTVPLTFETLGFAGQSITVLPGGGITDSATAGTAMSTGYQHPSNGTISIDTNGAVCETILEKAKSLGCRTGILTTDDITGATPGSFGAHEASRTETAEIRQDYLVDEADAGDAFHPASQPNVLMGGGYLAAYAAQAAGLGYDVVTDAAYLGATTSPHVMGLFGTTVFTAEYANPPATQPLLAQMVTNSLALLSGSGAPFFLMVEGALIDKLSHSNIAAGIGPEVDQLDIAVEAALAWRDGTAVPDDTLVIVTADHETGGLTVSDTGALTFASTDHTTRNVGLYATWPSTLAGQAVDNTEIFFLMEDFLTAGQPPVPQSAAAADIGSSSARLTWTTREPSSSDLRTQQGELVSANASRVTSHSVLLSGLQPSTTYTVLVSSTDLAGNTGTAPVTFTTAAESSTVTLIPAGSTWKYSATGTNLATAWRARTYNDATWPSGPAQLGYGDGDEATLISKTTIYSCYYFRHTFHVDDPNALTDLTLRLLRDDGAVVYLNGTEIARYGMPTGTISFSTWASTATDYPWDAALAVPAGLLVPGDNVIAVEIHQCSSTSTDISLDLELTAARREVSTLVPLGSYWKYEASGADLGTAWRATAYDDTAWPGGPSQLGYGDGDEATLVPKASPVHSCYYFRHEFNVADPGAIPDLTLRLLRDDGAVVYLNGTEIARYSLPAGAISFTNWATTATNYDWDPAVAVPVNLLLPGRNVLAVEVHQCNSTSSDISLDLVLSTTGSVTADAPPVADPKTVTLAEDSSSSVTLTGSDADGDPLTFRVTAAPAHGTLGGTAPALTYTPAANYAGSDSFAYVANDGTQDSAAAAVTITVTPVNDAPAANAQTVSLAEDTPTAITLYGSDPEGDTLAYAVVSAPAHGTLTGVAPNLTYTPAPNYSGADGFAFTVSDGALVSAAAEVSITVTPVNDAPVADAQGVSTAEDVPVGITLSGADVEGSALSYAVTVAPAHGTLTGVAPNLTYTPAPNYSGADSFAFTVSDGALASAAAAVTIAVTPVNDDPPTAPQDVTATAGDARVTLAWSASSDPDAGGTLTYSVFRRLQGETAYGDPVATGLTGTTWTDTGVENGATYFYTVRCVDDTGRFADSAEVSASPAGADPTAYVIGAPTLTAGSVSGDFASTRVADGAGQVLTETSRASAGVLDATYVLHTAADPALISGLTLHAGVISGTWNDPWKVYLWNGTAWEEITAAIVASGTFIAAAPQAYVDPAGDIRVRFTDGSAIRKEVFNSLTVDLLKADITVTTPPTEPPAAPAGLTAQAVSASSIALTWTDQADNEQSYEVERSPDGASWQLVATLAANAGGFTDGGLAAGTTYFYRVRAVNSIGASAYSGTASARTNAEAALNAPSNLVAKALPKQKISLTWTDNSSDETGFRIERSTDGATFTALATAAAGATAYTDSGLTVGTSYYYRIVALRGATVSAPSNVSSAVAK